MIIIIFCILHIKILNFPIIQKPNSNANTSKIQALKNNLEFATQPFALISTKKYT